MVSVPRSIAAVPVLTTRSRGHLAGRLAQPQGDENREEDREHAARTRRHGHPTEDDGRIHSSSLASSAPGAPHRWPVAIPAGLGSRRAASGCQGFPSERESVLTIILT